MVQINRVLSVANATRHGMSLATALASTPAPGATADRARQSSVTQLAPDNPH